MSTTDATLGAAATSWKDRINLAPVQKFGRSLMLPIASLPAAALLLRLGQDDLLGKDGAGWEHVAAVIGAAGNALFANLPLLFAVGVAIGMAKKADGSTALAAVVGYLVFKGVGDAMSPYVLDNATVEQARLGTGGIQYGVLGGIVTGLVAAYLWQRYHRIALPPYLAFFGGRRFVPIITSVVDARDRGADGLRLPRLQQRPDQPGRVGHQQRRDRRLRLRHAQPAADPARPAPHPQQPAVVRVRRPTRPAGSSTTATSRGSCTATRRPAPS